MLWPERQPSAATEETEAPPTLGYGLRFGAAGASAAAIGFALGLEHVGWATAACLLVMRPAAEMQRLRSVGRIAAAAATRAGRWYVTPAFTTFLVLPAAVPHELLEVAT